MKVRITVDEGEVYDEVVDIGKYDRDRHRSDEAYQEEASRKMHHAMKNWLLFPTSTIRITPASEKDRACFSERHLYVE